VRFALPYGAASFLLRGGVVIARSIWLMTSTIRCDKINSGLWHRRQTRTPMKMGRTTEIPGLFKTEDGYAVRLQMTTGSLTINKRKLLPGASKAEALIALEQLREEAKQEAEASSRGEDPRATLTVFVRRWMKELGIRKADGEITVKTTETHVANMERFVLPYLGAFDVYELKPKDLKQWMFWLSELKRPAIRKARNKRTYPQAPLPYAKATLAGAWRTLRAFCGWLTVEADLPRNPAREIRFTVKAAAAKPKATLTQDEVAKLLEAAKQDRDPNVRIMLLVFLSGAMRASELSALTRDDVDFEKGTITISKSFVEGNIGAPKTEGSRRTVVLPPEVLLELKGFFAWQDAKNVKGLPILFPTMVGTHREPSSFKAPFKRCAARAGIDKHLTSHAMRRTSNNLIRKTAGEIVARAITGHTTQQMTQHYSEVDHDERTAVLRAAFGGALGTQKSNPSA
jgi:integrase